MVMIPGYTYSFVADERDFWFVKTDSGGKLEWSKTYGGTRDEGAHSLVETSDGGYALSGYRISSDSPYRDFWFVKTDANGNIQWNQTYGGAGHEWAHSLVELSDGGYVLAGSTSSFGAGSYDFWLIRSDAQGIPEFPPWTILPLITVVALAFIFFRRKLSKKRLL